MKALKVTAGLILVLVFAAGLARLAVPSLAAPQVVNTIAGSVFVDSNLNGSQDAGEPGAPDIKLELYSDDNGNGLIDKHDHRLSKLTSDAEGVFAFRVGQSGVFLVKVDTKSLPKHAALTTLNRQAASFNELGQTDADNHFGYTDAPYVDDEALVSFTAGTAKARIKEIIDGYGLKLKLKRYQEGIDVYLLTTPPGEVDAVISYLGGYAEVAYAERNGKVGGGWTPGDPDYADPTKSYGLRRIQAETAWETTKGDAATLVALVDSGLALTHPEFAGRVSPGWDFVNDDADPSDDNGHGTHVAGIIAAAMDNGEGSTGVAPGVTLMPVKALNAANAGTWANVAAGIVYAVDHGASVINLSLGGHVASITLHDAIAYAAAHDVVVVAGSGNLPDGEPFYPAAYPEVLAVSATDATDAWWTSSDYGDWVDVAAPGDAIWSTLWTSAAPETYATKSGTSMATGFVSGLAALVRSARPELSTLDVQVLIQQASDDKGEPGPDAFYGWGRINAGAALGIAGAWVPVTPMPTATATPMPTSTPTPTRTPSPTPIPYVARVNVGSTAPFTDGAGQVWPADKTFVAGSWGYTGGSAKSYSTLVAGTNDDPLFQKLRDGITQYQLTVPNGAYQVRFRFADFAVSKVGDRVMQISIEGVTVETGLDVYKTAGKAGALDRIYAVNVADGVLSIAFTKVSGKQNPMVSAIEIQGGATAAPTPTLTPTPIASAYLQRIDSGSARDYTDSQGRIWEGDQIYDSVRSPTWGSIEAGVQSGVVGEPFADSRLFETWVEGGKLEYKFDVSPATYQVTLRFAELAVVQADKRVMQITIEGNPVETALDVYALTGGGASLDRTYTVPVADGQLNIGFTKIGGRGAENPMVAAVAVAYVGPLPAATATPTATPTVTRTNTPTPTKTPLATPTNTPPPFTVRVNVGSTTYTDKSALVWLADKAYATGSWGYVGGTTGKATTALPNTTDDTLYQKYRTQMTEYKFTVPNGTYQVRLRFAEFSTTTVGARAMKITLEGVTVDNALDVVALAAGQGDGLRQDVPGHCDGWHPQHRLCTRRRRQPGPGDFGD